MLRLVKSGTRRAASQQERCPHCHQKLRRGNPANARYWLLLHRVAEQLRPLQQGYSPEQWHIWFKSRFLGADDVTLPSGKVLTMVRSSAELTTAEFSDYMSKVEAWAAEHDVYLDEL